MSTKSVFNNVVIIGTSHIAKKSVDNIVQTFNDLNPDIICVELDHQRLHGLLSGEKPNYGLSGIKTYGLQGYLFAVIASVIQKKLGNVVGMQPGSDMLTAVNLARDNNKKLFLIDQNIEITLKRFSKEFSWKEKFRIVWDICSAPFVKRNRIKINLNDVPEDKLIVEILNQMKVRYPGIYSSLIEERNIFMAKKLYGLSNENSDKKILAVIGAGHQDEVLRLLKQEYFKRDKVR